MAASSSSGRSILQSYPEEFEIVVIHTCFFSLKCYNSEDIKHKGVSLNESFPD